MNKINLDKSYFCIKIKEEEEVHFFEFLTNQNIEKEYKLKGISTVTPKTQILIFTLFGRNLREELIFPSPKIRNNFILCSLANNLMENMFECKLNLIFLTFTKFGIRVPTLSQFFQIKQEQIHSKLL